MDSTLGGRSRSGGCRREIRPCAQRQCWGWCCGMRRGWQGRDRGRAGRGAGNRTADCEPAVWAEGVGPGDAGGRGGIAGGDRAGGELDTGAARRGGRSDDCAAARVNSRSTCKRTGPVPLSPGPKFAVGEALEISRLDYPALRLLSGRRRVRRHSRIPIAPWTLRVADLRLHLEVVR